MKRVLFVYSDRSCVCARKRCLEVVQALHQHKQKTVRAEMIYCDEVDDRLFHSYDVVVLQRLGANQRVFRPEEKKRLIHRMKERQKTGGFFVYDIDDYLFDSQGGFPKLLLQEVDAALAPNEEMMRLMAPYQNKRVLIRTHIDLESHDAAVVQKVGAEDVFKIGWFSIHAYGLDLIRKIAPLLRKKHRIEFHCFAGEPFYSLIKAEFDPELLIVHPRLALCEMYAILKGMNLLVNPTSFSQSLLNVLGISKSVEKEFGDAKSEIKYVHAGAAAIPIVSSPSSSYRYAIKHGENGFLADTVDEWMGAIEILIQDPELAKNMGLKARKDVEKHYSFPYIADRYEELIYTVGS